MSQLLRFPSLFCVITTHLGLQDKVRVSHVARDAYILPFPWDDLPRQIQEAGQFHVAFAAANGTVKLLNIKSEECIRNLRGQNSRTKSVMASQDRNRILTLSEVPIDPFDGTNRDIKVWDMRTGKCIQTIRLVAGTNAKAWLSRDGESILSWTHRAVLIWDVATGACIHIFRQEHDFDTVADATFSPNGEHVLTVGARPKLWNTETGECVQEFDLGEITGWSSSVIFGRVSNNGHRVLTVCLQALLWNAHTGEYIRTLVNTNGWLADAEFSNDDQKILQCCSLTGRVDVFATETGDLLQTLLSPSPMTSAVFSLDARRVLTSANREQTVKIWSAETGECLRAFEVTAVKSAAFLFDESHVLTTSEDNTIKLWNVQTGINVRSIDIPGQVPASTTSIPSFSV